MSKEELLEELMQSKIREARLKKGYMVKGVGADKEYHERYPSHGYRWLNAKIRLDTGLIVSDPYAHKCCKATGIKSRSKHYKYKKPGHQRMDEIRNIY